MYLHCKKNNILLYGQNYKKIRIDANFFYNSQRHEL